MRTEVYEVSTVLGLCTVFAILAREARTSGTRRVLIVSINSRYPEVESWFRDNDSLQDTARSTFDLLIELNDEIFPIHPSHWKYERGWTGHRKRWTDLIGSRHVDVLYLESIQAPPSWSLAQLFSEAEIRVYSDGLMVYSPTRVRLPKDVARRVSEVIYVDYLQGVEPLLLDEAQPRTTSLHVDELRPHFVALQSGLVAGDERKGPKAVFLGQAMANAKMMKHEAEATLYVQGLSELARMVGPTSVLFKPHTSAPTALTTDVQRGFLAATGCPLETIEGRVPIESVIEAERTVVVAGVFSTALFTVAQLFNVPAFTCGTKDVLYGLRPYENSNRIPLIAADILLPTIRSLVDASAERPGESPSVIARELAEATRGSTREFRAAQIVVGYHMQPKLLSHRKEEAERLAEEGSVRYLDLYLVGRNNRSAEQRGRMSRVVSETALWLARMTLNERKIRKLERDPERFFEDSRAPGASLIGRAYRRLVG